MEKTWLKVETSGDLMDISWIFHGYLVDTSSNHSVHAHDDSHRRFLQWWIYPMAVSENGVYTEMATFSHIFFLEKYDH